MRKLTLLLTVFLLTSCVVPIVTPEGYGLASQPTPIPTLTATPEPTSTPAPVVDSEGEYYRGIYDLCRWLIQQTGHYVDCMAFVERSNTSGWYEQPSKDWQWPLPAPTVAPGTSL